MVTLPENFENYEEARREGFLKVKALKEKGVPVVGIFCTYTPIELIHAAGAVAVSLCGTSDEPIHYAERHLPKNLCPLIKSSYGFAISEQCPYFYFADLLVGETTCDGKKKMYELLNEIKPIHVMHLPQGQDMDHAFVYWREELLRLKEVLEKTFNVEITEDILREEIKERNRERKILMDFYELGKLNPSPISGCEINETIEALGFQFDRKSQCDFISKRTKELKEKYEKELKSTKSNRPRILITGCPVNGVRNKVLKTIEESGADIVAFENCSGVREKMTLVDETIDPIDALTEKYLNVSCSVMTPNPRRFEALDEMIDEYQIDGVIEVVLQACHTFNVEAYNVKKFVTEKKHKPYLYIETDYSELDMGQMNTRINALLEML
ncbi:benzoyl-CoA reductase/2-hydroxyglutaryl-CoA dehydratase subunit BcrC/BadD/HgdB [Keratinibaculum paraultunense]|uniref:Benzoyl-CoA reductase/2-hydroxyglutaryl-CoA dehydratase subunit BcrC/BadD/HgdB n=1 Tax=Keratinibaculum paraultunense TaxID=1278232 RepID=A0A4R3KXZ6_9FIRM|nr:double-cubane-cluster-containing anaerobic reductase [Keratinibaculum paraultunense]QQY78984.1 2-hydroxyacyl-CoA dehydratase [Keratinibaculum paraultunense]TCS90605.1 benzoyl-CoA reductase/2-hydroxyglutaryl-CoA dehydratase subunit BcrC/BadD/HgdB [Keratinibaculum paraultunense]